MNARQYDALSVALLVGSAVAGLLLLPSLPDQFAIHFGTAGDPDSFTSPLVGVLLLPVIGLGSLLFVRGISSVAGSEDVPPAFGLLLSAFLAYVQGVVLAWNLGYPVDVGLAVLPGVLVLLVVGLAIDRLY
ncbi:DUF1648 domain-containing protein [Halopelagius longus]|uniref:DUF1648 domain-containing protein n=1 Tax=Halopelagius longus TaxID=1236180 RepID=A0A1H1B7R6_9EURY|nr:DUF1648 domain-containing protein [Halopelagius longus]RDI70676.1 DUF1648 domain-containing protein [Halopelagius longus]SDQ47940.1 Protein of unknown function [Halopelagius longus]